MKHICSFQSSSDLSNVQEGDVQPNAVDLRVDKVFRIRGNMFMIDEEQKVHRGSDEMQPDAQGYWVLEPGDYEVIMENKIRVAAGEAGFVITRSSLNRNAVFLTSGLYDSGYGQGAEQGGVMAAVMHVGSVGMKIKKGTRIGQYLNFDAETLNLYDGDYGTDDGHDAKYN